MVSWGRVNQMDINFSETLALIDHIMMISVLASIELHERCPNQGFQGMD
jgi:hypothetical protein